MENHETKIRGWGGNFKILNNRPFHIFSDAIEYIRPCLLTNVTTLKTGNFKLAVRTALKFSRCLQGVHLASLGLLASRVLGQLLSQTKGHLLPISMAQGLVNGSFWGFVSHHFRVSIGDVISYDIP